MIQPTTSKSDVTKPDHAYEGPSEFGARNLVADKWGQHEEGRRKGNERWQVVEKGTPWRHFWEDKSRLTGVPKKSLSNIWDLQ